MMDSDSPSVVRPRSGSTSESKGKVVLKQHLTSMSSLNTPKASGSGVKPRSGSLSRRSVSGDRATPKFTSLLDTDGGDCERNGRESRSPLTRKRSISPFGVGRHRSGSGKELSKLRKGESIDYTWSPKSSESKRRGRAFTWLLKQPSLAQAFGTDLTAAYKAVWLGTTLLNDTNDAWQAVRTILADPDPVKVFVVLSPKSIGIVKNKEKSKNLAELHKLLVQRESPSNVRLVLTELDDKDGLLLAYITENSFLHFNHIHVFGMKRAADGMDLVKEIGKAAKLEGETGASSRLVSHTQEVSDDEESEVTSKSTRKKRKTTHEDHSAVYMVHHLGSAPVSSRAWWNKIGGNGVTAKEADAKSDDQRFESVVSYFRKRLQELGSLDPSIADASDTGFGVEVALMVSTRKIELYRTLTQALLRGILPTNILEVRAVVLSEETDDFDREAMSPEPVGIPPSIAMTMTPEQRIEVMKSVAAGNISVDEAVEVVLETGAAKDADELVLISHRDPRLNTTMIEAVLCSGVSAQCIMDSIIQCRTTVEKRGFSVDPFAVFDTSSSKALSPGKKSKIQKLVGELQEFELSRDELTAVEHLGNGEFGEVYLANQVVGTTEDEEGFIVDVEEKRAVKTLKATAQKQYVSLFMEEAKIHAGLKHENIVQLQGICMAQQPRLVVLEYCMYGDLQKVLQTCKSKEISLSPGEQAGLMNQIASALNYLHNNRIIHMDLATRNVLVDKNSRVKVADFGLARRYEPDCNHWQLKGKLRLPFLWVPPENLPSKMWNDSIMVYEPLFGEPTDIWAFGVLAWEIVSYGEAPYEWKTKNHDLVEILKMVHNGYRLIVPDSTPAFIHDMIESCFKERGLRPNFEELKVLLSTVPKLDYHMRDIGKLLNAPLEEQIEILVEQVSLQRRESSIQLQLQLPRSQASSLNPSRAVSAATSPTSTSGEFGFPRDAPISPKTLAFSPSLRTCKSRGHSRSSSLTTNIVLETVKEPGGLDRRSSVLFDPSKWTLGPRGSLMRSPRPVKDRSQLQTTAFSDPIMPMPDFSESPQHLDGSNSISTVIMNEVPSPRRSSTGGDQPLQRRLSIKFMDPRVYQSPSNDIEEAVVKKEYSLNEEPSSDDEGTPVPSIHKTTLSPRPETKFSDVSAQLAKDGMFDNSDDESVDTSVTGDDLIDRSSILSLNENDNFFPTKTRRLTIDFYSNDEDGSRVISATPTVTVHSDSEDQEILGFDNDDVFDSEDVVTEESNSSAKRKNTDDTSGQFISSSNINKVLSKRDNVDDESKRSEYERTDLLNSGTDQASQESSTAVGYQYSISQSEQTSLIEKLGSKQGCEVENSEDDLTERIVTSSQENHQEDGTPSVANETNVEQSHTKKPSSAEANENGLPTPSTSSDLESEGSFEHLKTEEFSANISSNPEQMAAKPKKVPPPVPPKKKKTDAETRIVVDVTSSTAIQADDDNQTDSQEFSPATRRKMARLARLAKLTDSAC